MNQAEDSLLEAVYSADACPNMLGSQEGMPTLCLSRAVSDTSIHPVTQGRNGETLFYYQGSDWNVILENDVHNQIWPHSFKELRLTLQSQKSSLKNWPSTLFTEFPAALPGE